MVQDQGSEDIGRRAVEVRSEIRVEPTQPGRYANNVLLTRSQNELFLDFYFVEPPIGPDYTAAHIGRIVLPTTVMRGLLDALDEQIKAYEQEYNTQLINQRRQEEKS